MKVIAHRGLAGLYPENTILSFKKALELPIDAMELDVQLSSDGEVVVFHDEELRRTTGEDGYLKERTFAQLRELNAAAAHPECAPEKIPTLREYFELTENSNIATFLELKNSFFPYDGMEKKVLEILDEFDRREDVIIYSANHFSAFAFRAMAPEIQIAFPFDNWIIGYGEYCSRYHVQSCVPYHLSLNEATAEEITKHGVMIYPWTVDEPDEMRRMMELGVDGIMSNRADILCGLLEK